MFGERIRELRKQLGLSQEDLADRLNVSRQAVSKWETGLTNPDTENLILLANLFEISVDELIKNNSENAPSIAVIPGKQTKRKLLIPALLAAVIIISAAAIWILADKDSQKPQATQIITPFGEYALIRGSEISSEAPILEIGPMDSSFPWGTDLSGEDSFYTSGDMPGVEFHNVECGDIVISYSHNIETGGEYLTAMTTASSGYATLRGIKTGNTENELISAYGDDLLYRPDVYSEIGEFCMYNSLYAYMKESISYDYIVFYVLDGHITGIEVNMAQDGGPAYYADNVNTFRLKDGKPDYSQRQEPDLETLSKERKVYVALHTLLCHSMTKQDSASFREAIFSGLRNIDWREYGKLGEMGKDADTIQELIHWLDSHQEYTAEELTGMQLALLSNLDGIYSDMYSTVLCNALIKEPAVFIECMDSGRELFENSEKVAMMVIYGAGPNSNIEGVETIINDLLRNDALTDGAVVWAERLRELCAEALGNA